MSILTLGKIDFRAETITRDNGWHNYIIKKAIHQEVIAILMGMHQTK